MTTQRVDAGVAGRPARLAHALRLEYLSLGWALLEAAVALPAAWVAGSVALLGFGLDSLIESASAGVLLWRLLAERRAASRGSALDGAAVERLDRRAHRLVGASLYLLAAGVAADAVGALWTRDHPAPSPSGIAITSLTLVVMVVLARAKRRAAAALESRALHADSFQTTACWWLSLIALAGMGLNALLGWWWADPAAALAMTPLIVQEGRAAWRGEDCDCA